MDLIAPHVTCVALIGGPGLIRLSPVEFQFLFCSYNTLIPTPQDMGEPRVGTRSVYDGSLVTADMFSSGK